MVYCLSNFFSSNVMSLTAKPDTLKSSSLTFIYWNHEKHAGHPIKVPTLFGRASVFSWFLLFQLLHYLNFYLAHLLLAFTVCFSRHHARIYYSFSQSNNNFSLRRSFQIVCQSVLHLRTNRSNGVGRQSAGVLNVKQVFRTDWLPVIDASATVSAIKMLCSNGHRGNPSKRDDASDACGSVGVKGTGGTGLECCPARNVVQVRCYRFVFVRLLLQMPGSAWLRDLVRWLVRSMLEAHMQSVWSCKLAAVR